MKNSKMMIKMIKIILLLELGRRKIKIVKKLVKQRRKSLIKLAIIINYQLKKYKMNFLIMIRLITVQIMIN